MYHLSGEVLGEEMVDGVGARAGGHDGAVLVRGK